VQEGDPKYLAPEVLHSNYNITCAADVFSLGMTILELATDLDLPRGGEAWHQLRNGQIPSHLVSSLSEDLVDIIMRMIEPDHLKRARVDDLLNMPRIRSLINRNKRKILYRQMANYFRLACNQFKNISLAIVQMIFCPYFKIRSFIEYHAFGNATALRYSKLNVTNPSQDKEESLDKQNTSTPKKDEASNAIPIALMHVDDDDGPGN
jgi:serine/threonine protein kinase